jgi:hypothetical protein
LVATDDDLRDSNVGTNIFAAKLVGCIKQARLFLTLQLANCTPADGL